MNKEKKAKFKVGDIVENKDGWKRKIAIVKEDYLYQKGRFGYFYYAEAYPSLEFIFTGMCSEEHLLRWINK